MKLKHRMVFALLLLSFLGYFLLLSFHIQPITAYTITYLSSSALYLITVVVLKRIEISKSAFLWLLSAAVILRLAFVFAQPVGSPDYYRYAWDGSVEAHGINPYQYAPDDSALAALHTDDLPRLVTYPNMRTIYPPLSEILFYVAHVIGGESYVGIKILIFIFDLAAMLGIILLLGKLNQDRRYLFLYALCPLPLIQFFLDGHVDSFGFGFLIFAIYFYLADRKTASYILLGLSMCIKPLALIMVPILFFMERGAGNRLKALIIPVAVFVLSYVPFVFTGKPFQSLMTYTENWTFNGPVFHILFSLIHDNQKTRAVCGVLLIAVCLPVILSKKDLLTKIYMSIFLLFIFSPVVYPWYVGWLVVLLPLVPRWSGIVFAASSSLTVFTVLNYQLTGVWKDYPAVMIVEYVPVILLYLWEMKKDKEATNPT